jgi:hypothetical protein
MRFIVMIKATPESEAGFMPSEQLLTEMGKYNEELMNAGVMLAAEGLQPSSKGARVSLSSSERVVTDGPFTETKELVAGFWIWKLDSLDEAIDWARRCPNPDGLDGEIEIRPIASAEDFGEAFTPEWRAAEAQMREELEARQNM